MFFLARKNLFAEKTRLIMSISGVAFAVLLILVLGGLYRGWQTKITAYIDSLSTDLVVGQAGSADTTHSMSFLPATLAADLRQVQGVTRIDQFNGRQITVNDPRTSRSAPMRGKKGQEWRIFIVGIDPAAGRNGPLKMVSGTANIVDGQVIIDQAFSRKTGYGLGDIVPIAGQKLTVAGISTGGNSLIYQYTFVTENDVRQILQLGPLVNYFLVSAGNPAGVTASLERQFPELNVMTKEEFAANNRKIVTEVFLPIVGILFVIAFIVGSAIVGLTIYTATIEKSREYGVLKAIGSSNGLLYRVVLEQSFIAGAAGFVIGLGLSFLVSWLAGYFISGFITAVGLTDVVLVFATAMLMSLLAAWIPAKRLASIDPALVFKA